MGGSVLARRLSGGAGWLARAGVAAWPGGAAGALSAPQHRTGAAVCLILVAWSLWLASRQASPAKQGNIYFHLDASPGRASVAERGKRGARALQKQADEAEKEANRPSNFAGSAFDISFVWSARLFQFPLLSFVGASS